MLQVQKLFKLTIPTSRSLTNKLYNYVHHDGTSKPLQRKLYFKPEHQKILFKRRLVPTAQLLSNDVIIFPGFDSTNILRLVSQFQQRKVELTATNLCMLIYMFTKYNAMTDESFDIIEKQAYRFTGEYQIRSIYGGLIGSIIYNRQELIKFFMNEYKLSDKKFSMQETASIMKAFLNNKFFGKKTINTIWTQNFRDNFLDGLYTLKITNINALTTIFDLMSDLKQKDPQVWKRLIFLMKKKKSWGRIPILERLNLLRSQYKQADALFNVYFQQMAADAELVSRYNLTQLRFYTPLQIIANTEKNPSDYYPKIRTLIPQKQDANEWNAKYQQYLTVGAVKQEEQVIKDKSKSLGFAIRDRYQNLEADGLDFSKMSKQQFQDMFGDFAETMRTIETEDAKIEQLEKQKEEQENSKEAENQKQAEEQNKKKKGKGKDKKNKQNQQQAGEAQSKKFQKKQKPQQKQQ